MTWRKKLLASLAFVLAGVACSSTSVGEIADVPEPTVFEVISTTTEPAIPSTPEPTAIETDTPSKSDDRDRGCNDGFAPIFSGESDGGGFDANGGQWAPAFGSICRNELGSLHFYGVDLGTGREVRLPACQQSPEVWVVANGESSYTMVDERNSNRGTPGVLSFTSADGTVRQWNLWIDILRDANLQDSPLNTTC